MGGFSTVSLAVQLCTNISLYGYGLEEGSNHYYDDTRNVSHNKRKIHDYDAEKDLYREWAHRGYIDDPASAFEVVGGLVVRNDTKTTATHHNQKPAPILS